MILNFTLSLNLSQSSDFIEERIIDCLTEVKERMAAYKFKLNSDKTDVLIESSVNRFNSCLNDSISFPADGQNINPMETVVLVLSLIKSCHLKITSPLLFKHAIFSSGTYKLLGRN